MKSLPTSLGLSLLLTFGLVSPQGRAVDIPNLQTDLKQLKQRSYPISSHLETLSGIWEGYYRCGQGITKLQLVIEAHDTDNIDALFIFSEHPSNPGVPSGAFAMTGTYWTFWSNAFRPAGMPDITNSLELEATEWIQRPSGYRTVDISGTLHLDENRLTGTIPQCYSGFSHGFEVERISDLEEEE